MQASDYTVVFLLVRWWSSRLIVGCTEWSFTKTHMRWKNVCPVVAVRQRAKSSSWDQIGVWPVTGNLGPWQRPYFPLPLPPHMADKGTRGRGRTAEKTRHTRTQPLNTDVIVEESWRLLKWYTPPTWGMHTFIQNTGTSLKVINSLSTLRTYLFPLSHLWWYALR